MRRAVQIGGHYSAFIDYRRNALPGSIGYVSARAGLFALLAKIQPRRVFVPNYMCDAVFDAISKAKCPVVRYALGGDFTSAEELRVSDGDIVIVPNYFGLCRDAILRQLEHIPRSAMVIDCSQAYFEPAFDCLATIYSPRKFLPVPDGGFIASNVTLARSSANESASLERYQYLLRCEYLGTTETRSNYLAAEASLEVISDEAVSTLTLRLAETVDVDFIARRRRENYARLSVLDGLNGLKFEMGKQVPLCYPLLVQNGALLKSEFIRRRIFLPTYWSNVIGLNPFEEDLVSNALFIPVDHRLDPIDVDWLIENIFDVMKV